MTINSINRRLEIGDIIYKVVYDPFINNKPEWFIIPYKIKDIYYTDACYAELVMIHDSEESVHKIILNQDTLEDYFYTLDAANAYVNVKENEPITHAWGYNNHTDTDIQNNPTVGDSSHNYYFELDTIYLDDENEKITVGNKIVNLAKRTYDKLSKKMLEIFDKVVNNKDEYY